MNFDLLRTLPRFQDRFLEGATGTVGDSVLYINIVVDHQFATVEKTQKWIGLSGTLRNMAVGALFP